MIKSLFVLFVPVLLAAAPPDGGQPPLAPEKPTLTQPTGDYHVAWLSLEGAGEPLRVFVALRDRKPVQFWATRSMLPGIPKTPGTLKLLTDACRGTLANDKFTADFDLRLVSIWAPTKRLNLINLALDLSKKSGVLSGTWAIKIDGKEGPRGSANGAISSDAEAAKDRILQAWPHFYGQGTASRGPAFGKPMISDLSSARPMWRSETSVLSGWGTGADGRYKSRAIVGTLCGGTSSPVVADGLIFLYHYRPSGDVEPGGENAALVETYKDHPIEKDWMRRWFSRRADVVVSAIDSASGRTMWESVWPLKQGNFQTHKWRGLNFVPAVGNGTIIVLDYSFGVHAHDTRSGALKWSLAGLPAVAGDKGTVGPVICGNSVIVAGNGDTVGLDLSTGAERFKGPRANSARLININGKDRVLLVGTPLALLDPADGKVLWKSDVSVTDKLDTRSAMPICDGDKAIFPRLFDDKKKQEGAIVAYHLTDSGIEKAWETKPTITWDENLSMCAANGHVFAACKDGLRVLELNTGNPVSFLEDLKCGSNATLAAVDARIFYQPEGQHGRQSIHLIDSAAPSALRILSRDWRPPHNDTTAYGVMPLANVILDGRLIIRGLDGIYCYDLRAASN